MKSKHVLLNVFILLVVISLAGCVRPASQAPTGAVDTDEAQFPLPGTNDDIMQELQQAATQTLMALEAGTAEAQPKTIEETPVSTEAVEPTALVVAATPTTAAVIVPTATPGIPTSYTLHKGEHPYCIARRFNVNPEEMLRLSGLSPSSTYYSGMKLNIPQTGNPFPAERELRSHPSTYVVQSGDTLYSIACLYGNVDPNAIAAANGLSSADANVTAGQTIQIP